MNSKISVFLVCFEAIICLLLYNLHDCNFKELGDAQREIVRLRNIPL